MEPRKEDDRRKRFFPTVSLGSLIASLVFVGSGIGVYTSVIADVNSSKIEIQNLKQNEAKREVAEKESRQEIKGDIRDVKADVKEVNQKLDRLMQEIVRNNSSPRQPTNRDFR